MRDLVQSFNLGPMLMVQWFERVGYSADIAGLEREFGRALTKLPDWARRLSQMKSFEYRRKKYE